MRYGIKADTIIVIVVKGTVKAELGLTFSESLSKYGLAVGAVFCSIERDRRFLSKDCIE
jgi:hypothetical protein